MGNGMIRDGKDISNGTRLNTDICIIGSGPAGVTAAWELQQAGHKVILIEGSRQVDFQQPNYYRQSWPDKVKLYNGLADGIFQNNEPNFLILPFDGHTSPAWERERVFGGTSSHWGGQSRPLDPIVFEKRPGFPGWPIKRQDLDPYYKKASSLCHLYGDYGDHGKNFTAEFWAKELNASVPDLNGFNPEMYQFMGNQWLNFATRTFDGKTIGETSVDVILNASLLNINHQNNSVQKLTVASMNDDIGNPQKQSEFTITANTYVLACGAVANARQLLLSDVGNELVGRYFLCHPLSVSSIIQTTQNYLNSDELRLMNGSGWSDPTGNGVRPTGRFTLDKKLAKQHEIGRCWFWANSQYQSNQMYFEMAPNYNSHVTLNDTTDPVFGQKQTHIHWEFNELDQKTYETNTKLFNESSGAYDNIISFPSWKDVSNQWTVNGHHIGTTRMSESSSGGVVDANLKIHGMDNMYVAGSSVFPSTGVSNPTMTIIALSIRLADHLKTQM